MIQLSQAAIFAICTLLLGACASSPDSPLDTGELITQRGDRISGYGSAWSAGQQKVANGEKMVRNGTSSLEKAQERLANAQQAVSEAEAKVRSAEADKVTGQMLIAQGNQEMLRAEENYTAARKEPRFEGSATPR